MAGTVEKKLQELGIALATPTAPVANYVPFVRTGNLLVVSGQVCFDADGKLVAKGQLGGGVSIEDGQKAARACAVNLLAQVKAALGDLDKVVRVVRLGGFVNSAPGFLDGPKVMNGASDLMVAAFGEKGKHARSTVGVAALPADAAVEVEGHVRGVLNAVPRPPPALDWLIATADRPSRPARCRTRHHREYRERRARGDRRQLRHRDRRADQRRRRSHGASRRCARPPDRRRRPARPTRARRRSSACLPRHRRPHDDAWRFVRPRGGRVTLLVELKSRFDGDGRLPARVAQVLRRLSRARSAPMSFDPRELVALRRLRPAPDARHRCGKIPAASILGPDVGLDAPRPGHPCTGLDGAAAFRGLLRSPTCRRSRRGWRGMF